MMDEEEYKLKARAKAVEQGKTVVDAEKLKVILSKATQGPWHWTVHDYSMASLEGPAYEMDHVASISPCSACRKNSKEEGKWKWGRCTCPTEADADLMAMAPILAEAYLEAIKYPRKVADHIWQYGEGTFIWEDETQNWGGVEHSLEMASEAMERYAKNL